MVGTKICSACKMEKPFSAFPYGATCSEGHIEFLSIDHVNGNGAAHRRELGTYGGGNNFYVWLIKHDFPSGFRVLCMNCNCSRTHGRACPHDVERAASALIEG